MDNAIFYDLEDDQRHYKDYAGTGNAVNANNPVVRELILAALRYWAVGDACGMDSGLTKRRCLNGTTLATLAGQGPVARPDCRGPDLERRENHRRGHGTRPGRTKWVAFSERRFGRRGTADSGMMSGVSGVATMGFLFIRPTNLRQRRYLFQIRQRTREQHQFCHLS